MPMHLGPASNRTVFPSCYVNGSGKKAGDLLEFSLKLGAPADALQMLGGITLRPIGSDFAALRKNGNQAAGVTYFPDPNRLALRTVQQNLADKPFEIEYRLTVLDHYVAGKIACDLKQSVKVDPNGKADLQWPLPALPAGFYYATVEAHSGDKKLTDAKITFAVDLDHYTHPLTRPADFKEFWAARLKALRALPFDEKLTEDANRSTEAMRFFNLELTVAGGRRVKTLLLTPRKEGKYMARFAPAFDGKPTNIPTDSVLIGMPLGEFQMATYNRWVSAEDNNMLDCYLLALRLTDYLRSRADVDRIYLFGASRTGPIQFVNAALDGSRIAAVDVHVPTSAGIGWADKPYYAWGVPSGYTPTDANAVARFTAMAAYFDPVNFAPDMKAPFITAYGIDDTLSQPQGIELMYQLAASPWKRISRDPGGHQYSPGFQQLQKELAEHLKTAVSGTDDKIMKEH
jgi:cephalosporin-C deacetylase-like acetyl esterase